MPGTNGCNAAAEHMTNLTRAVSFVSAFRLPRKRWRGLSLESEGQIQLLLRGEHFSRLVI